MKRFSALCAFDLCQVTRARESRPESQFQHCYMGQLRAELAPLTCLRGQSSHQQCRSTKTVWLLAPSISAVHRSCSSRGERRVETERGVNASRSINSYSAFHLEICQVARVACHAEQLFLVLISFLPRLSSYVHGGAFDNSHRRGTSHITLLTSLPLVITLACVWRESLPFYTVNGGSVYLIIL